MSQGAGRKAAVQKDSSNSRAYIGLAFLYSLQKYSPQAKVIVFVDKSERKYLDKLPAGLQPHAVFVQPVDRNELKQLLAEGGGAI